MSPTPLRVLLVEDDPLDADLAREAVHDANVPLDLLLARDGDEALRQLREGARPDLILLDLRLPRLHGRATLAALKEDPSLRRIPVVIFTASRADDDVEACYDLHASAYLAKPLDHTETVEMMRDLHRFWSRVLMPRPQVPSPPGSGIPPRDIP